MTDFTEFEFKTIRGKWIRTCVASTKIDAVMDKLSCVTEVRFPIHR